MARFYNHHVSIDAWSLGNESGTGPNHGAMAGYLREYDPTRLCQYEAGRPGKNISDLRGDMYATVDRIREMLADPEDTRPIILVEYLYQIRNSGGGMAKFLALREQNPRFQGGYVWDWMDKSLLTRENFYGYGGDFGESFTDPECPWFMTNNGLLLADLTWKPVAYEVRQAYCPVLVEAGEAVYRVKNRSMGSLGRFQCQAALLEDGVEVARQPLALPQVPPGGQGELAVTLDFPKQPGREYFLLLELTREGALLGRYQFPLACPPGGGPQAPALPTPDPLIRQRAIIAMGADGAFATGGLRWEGDRVVGKGFQVRFDLDTGQVLGYKKNGRAYPFAGLRPCLERPYTGLDAEKGWGHFALLEETRGLPLVLGKSRLAMGPDFLYLVVPFALKGPYPIQGEMSYEVTVQGALACGLRMAVSPAYRLLARVGLELVLPRAFEYLDYYGQGPGENYPDRLLASYLAVHTATVTGQHVAFNPPSECGGHEAVRWLTLGDRQGRKITVTSHRPFHFDAKDYSVQAALEARHDHEIRRGDAVYLHLDAAHGPIGSDMAWSTCLPPEGCLTGGGYDLRVVLEFL
jgi:beta-galactosidase